MSGLEDEDIVYDLYKRQFLDKVFAKVYSTQVSYQYNCVFGSSYVIITIDNLHVVVFLILHVWGEGESLGYFDLRTFYISCF